MGIIVKEMFKLSRNSYQFFIFYEVSIIIFNYNNILFIIDIHIYIIYFIIFKFDK